MHDDNKSYESAKRGPLPRRIATRTHLCIDVRDFLDGATLAGASVLCGYDAAVGALAELLYELVFRVDDKGRVQSGEGVPLQHDLLWVQRGRGSGRSHLQGRGHFRVGVVGFVAIDRPNPISSHSFLATATEVTLTTQVAYIHVLRQ